MLNVDAEKRFDIIQVSKHSWCTNPDVEVVSLSRFVVPFPRRVIITRLSVINGMCFMLTKMKINFMCTEERVKKVVEEHRSSMFLF
jgi:hypothetical protein